MFGEYKICANSGRPVLTGVYSESVFLYEKKHGLPGHALEANTGRLYCFDCKAGGMKLVRLPEGYKDYPEIFCCFGCKKVFP